MDDATSDRGLTERSTRLLFVEDVEADMELVKAILTRAGLRVEIESQSLMRRSFAMPSANRGTSSYPISTAKASCARSSCTRSRSSSMNRPRSFPVSST